MAQSKQFRNLNSRQVRLYKNVSEDRLELLLDRFRASIVGQIDWIGSCAALFSVVTSLFALCESWICSNNQLMMFGLSIIFGTVVAYRMIVSLLRVRKCKPMTNEAFLKELAEEQKDEDATQTEEVKGASVSI